MILNQRELKRQIFDKKKKIKDKELFLSEMYRTLLTNMKTGVTSFKTKGQSYVYDGPEDKIAFTDGYDTYINYNNELVAGLDKTQKHFVFCGLNLHECAHILFTNFSLSKKSSDKLAEGVLYPSPTTNPYTDELEEYLADNGGTALVGLHYSILNCMEDGFVDRAIYRLIPGYGHCLKLVNKIAADKLSYRKSYEEQVKEKLSDEEIFFNLVLNYSRHGDIFIAEEAMDDELVKSFYEVKPIIAEAVKEFSPMLRMRKMNTVFCYLFHFVKMQNDKQQNNQSQQGSQQGQQGNSQDSQQNSQSSQGTGSSQSPQSNHGEQGEQGEQNSQEQQSQGDENQNKNGEDGSSSGQNTQNGEGDGQNGSKTPSTPSLSDVLKSLEEKSYDGEKTERKGNTEVNQEAVAIMQQTPGEEEEQNASAESPKTSPELERLGDIYAESKVQQEQEKEISANMKCDVKAFLDGEAAHANISCDCRRAKVTDRAIREYNESHTELDFIVRRFISDFEREIKERQLGDTFNNLYNGKRFEARQLVRSDKKFFSNKKAPEDIPDMAVGIVVDNSGSMSGDRIETAKKCAYITYEFCRKLGIPVFVCGHTTNDSKVQLELFADEHSIDGRDGMRIFDMHAQERNRDGYALRYGLNKLYNIPANDRILLVISDGRPNHDGYGLQSGKDDCQKCVTEFLKKGVLTITAAIGDPQGVKYVYKDGVSDRNSAKFMDITDLKKLPKAFIKIIKEHLEY